MAFDVDMPPDKYWHCALVVTFLSISTMCSTYFIVSMTFERFYSIIRPHKAASFNTIKRAKIIIICITIFSIVYSIPHLFTTYFSGKTCLVFFKGKTILIGRIKFWVDEILGFILPFVMLLYMNSIIIRTLLKRSQQMFNRTESQGQGQNECHNQGQGQSRKKSTKDKHAERQIIIMLLLVTFGFLILIMPSFSLSLYSLVVDFKKSPKIYADFHLLAAIGQKTFYTNFGINFFLYVISGQKFRGDLVKLFKTCLG